MINTEQGTQYASDMDYFTLLLAKHLQACERKQVKEQYFDQLLATVRKMRKQIKKKSTRSNVNVEARNRLTEDWHALVNGYYHERYFPTCYPFLIEVTRKKSNEDMIYDSLIQFISGNNYQHEATITDELLKMARHDNLFHADETSFNRFERHLLDILSFSKSEVERALNFRKS